MTMSKVIQIRDVPESVHRTLKARAATRGMSLSDYLRQDLVEMASRPTLEEIEARAGSSGRSSVATDAVVTRDSRSARRLRTPSPGGARTSS